MSATFERETKERSEEMKSTLAIAILSICLVPAVQAQIKKGIIAEAEPALGERGTSRVLYWNQDKDVAAGAIRWISAGRLGEKNTRNRADSIS